MRRHFSLNVVIPYHESVPLNSSFCRFGSKKKKFGCSYVITLIKTFEM